MDNTDAKRAERAIFEAAVEMLAGKDPERIARLAQVEFGDSTFIIPSLGRTMRITYPDWGCDYKGHYWFHIVALHYLNLADGTPVSGKAMGFADMPDGMVRGTKYDRTCASVLSQLLRGKSEEEVRADLDKFGAEYIPGSADLNVKLPVLPLFPIYLNIWFGDEEFPTSARMLVDRSAGHYMAVEDAVVLGDVILGEVWGYNVG